MTDYQQMSLFDLPPATTPTRPAPAARLLPTQLAPGQRSDGAVITARLTVAAERIKRRIEFCRRERQENTHKRAREGESFRNEARHLDAQLSVLQGLIAAWKEDRVPSLLRKVDGWAIFETLYVRVAWERMHAGGDSQGDYNRVVDAGFTSAELYNEGRRLLMGLKLDPQAGQEGEEDRLRRVLSEVYRSQIPGFFPTPADVTWVMLQHIHVRPTDRILEPSAGAGDMAAVIRNHFHDNALDVIEWNTSLRDVLALREFHVVGDDVFDEQHVAGSYDVIVANPPFEAGEDMRHARRYYELLAPGGRMACILSESAFYASTKKAESFQRWLEDRGAQVEDLPAGAFSGTDKPTNVKARYVVIDK